MRRELAPSAIRKHSIALGGFQTSISLEPPFWNGLRTLAKTNGMGISDLVHVIDQRRTTNNLNSAVRCAVLEFYQHALDSRERDRAHEVSEVRQTKEAMGARREQHVEVRQVRRGSNPRG